MTTFLVIGVAGLLLLAVSLVLGDLVDGLLDALAGDAFSTAVLGGFVSAFGFGAALVDAAGGPLPVSLPVGVVAGLVFAWFAAWLTRLVRDGDSDDTPAADDALGREGTVVSDIPADGYGTVRLRVGGHVVRLNARAERPLAPGTEVHVTAILSSTAVAVAPVWDDLPLPPSP